MKTPTHVVVYQRTLVRRLAGGAPVPVDTTTFVKIVSTRDIWKDEGYLC